MGQEEFLLELGCDTCHFDGKQSSGYGTWGWTVVPMPKIPDCIYSNVPTDFNSLENKLVLGPDMLAEIEATIKKVC